MSIKEQIKTAKRKILLPLMLIYPRMQEQVLQGEYNGGR